MKEVLVCPDQSQLPGIAKRILEIPGCKKIAFFGNLGSGKTTLIKELCTQLGISEVVTSPTFTLHNRYIGKNTVEHFDFYRIKSENELFELGFEEFFFSENYVFIEWPEKIPGFLPENFLSIKIDVKEDNSRFFLIESSAAIN